MLPSSLTVTLATKSVYLDGVFDGNEQATKCFQGHDQSLTIGNIEAWGSSSNFDGLIDQLSYTNRPKRPEEIFRDATLVVSFSFDNNSISDRGTLRINGSLFGNATFTAGHRGEALDIPNMDPSHLQVQGLVLLGTSNRSYSFSIWIRPNLRQQAAIIQASSRLDVSDWYLPLLGVTSAGELVSTSWDGDVVSVVGPVAPANSWTHVAVTYSHTNGLHLYVNGTFSNASMPFSFRSSSEPLYLFLGSPDLGSGCNQTYKGCGFYAGAVDEFRLYSRELSAGDVDVLAKA